MHGTETLRAVIVDDDADVRFLLRRLLERSGGVEVVGEAPDGRQAAAVASTAHPDLVLMDLNMPGVDGLTALPLVRAACAPSTAIIVISARPSQAALDAVAEGQAAGFLEKANGFGQLVSDAQAIAGATSGDSRQHLARWHLPAELSSGAVARRRLRRLLEDWQLSYLLDDAQLLTTELVNNAVVHAHSDVVLTVHRRERSVHFEVSDRGQGALRRTSPAPVDTNGRGLLLVEMLSADWGTAVNGEIKTVWFELERHELDAV